MHVFGILYLLVIKDELKSKFHNDNLLERVEFFFKVYQWRAERDKLEQSK
jgi:hypothetical protein